MLCLNELPGRNVQYWHTLGARPKTVGSPGRRRPMKNRGGRPRPQTTPAESPSKATQQAWLGEAGQAPRFTPEPPGDAGGRGRPRVLAAGLRGRALRGRAPRPFRVRGVSPDPLRATRARARLTESRGAHSRRSPTRVRVPTKFASLERRLKKSARKDQRFDLRRWPPRSYPPR